MDIQALIEAGLEQEGKEVWDEYRKYEPASLQAIVQYTRGFLNDLYRQGNPDEQNLRVLLIRMYVALSHLRLRIINLQ